MTDSESAESLVLTKAERKQRRREEKQRERERAAQRRERKTRLRWGAVLLGVAAIVAVVWILSGRGSGGDAGEARPLTGSVEETDWTHGNRQAPAVLVEYGDFQCPACATFYPVVKSLSEEMGDDLLVVWRHFPLSQAHAEAQLAAQAAEAAGRQGKFWEMHNLLFEKQSEWAGQSGAAEKFAAYANELGLNGEQFSRDLTSREAEAAVDDDYRTGLTAGITSTPTFYLNGEVLEGYRTLDEFRERIKTASQPR